MIWLALLCVLLAVAGALAWVLRRKAPDASIAAPPRPLDETPVPRDASLLERILGLGVVLGSLGAMAPSLLDPRDGGPLGPLLTPALIAVGVLIGALVFTGPRGRARFVTAMFDSDYRFAGRRGAYRLYRRTNEKSRRLAQLGRAPAMLLALAIGALACFGKPVVTPYQDGANVGGGGAMGVSGPLGGPSTSDLHADLSAAAASGDPEAQQVLAMLGGGAPAGGHFVFEGYTSERNIAWPITGAVLTLLFLRLLLTAGSSRPRAAR